MKDSVLNVVVIGCGAIAKKKHLPAISKNPNLHLKGLYNPTVQTAELCKAEFGCEDAKVYTDVHDMLNCSDVDVVFVCAPNQFHACYAVEALNNGKHVICEKPMASDFKSAQIMLNASLQNRKLLHISYQNRYTNQALYAKQLIQEGFLQNIYYAKAYALRRRAVPNWGVAGKKSQGGGPLIDIGTHAIDLALWLCEFFEPESVVGSTYNYLAHKGSYANYWGNWDFSHYETEDLAVGLVRMKNGMTLSVEASYALNISREMEASVDLFGEKGGLELRQEDGLTLIHEMGGQMVISRNDIQKTMRSLTPSFLTQSPSERENEAVVKMLMDGDTFDPSAAQALEVERIIAGLYRSAQEHREVRF